jgi:hypothetical protein
MATLRVDKVVSTLPGVLTPSTVYAVRTGAGFDLYISDSTGSVAHALNAAPGGGMSAPQVYAQTMLRLT